MLASTVLGLVSDLLQSIEGMQVINGGEQVSTAAGLCTRAAE